MDKSWEHFNSEGWCSNVILEGHQSLGKKQISWTDELLESAHRYVLLNSAVVEPFLEMHIDELRKRNYEKNASLLWKTHTEKFSEWLKEKVPIHSSSSDEIDLLRWLAYGPRKHALSYNGYIINGQRFHIKDIEKSTQNNGVSVKAMTMCRASAKDVSQLADVVPYYGVLKEIILLHYHKFQICCIHLGCGLSYDRRI